MNIPELIIKHNVDPKFTLINRIDKKKTTAFIKADENQFETRVTARELLTARGWRARKIADTRRRRELRSANLNYAAGRGREREYRISAPGMSILPHSIAIWAHRFLLPPPFFFLPFTHSM